MLLKGLETLDLRVEKASRTAFALAQALEAEAGVARVAYPLLDSHPQKALAQAQMKAGGTMLAVEVKGGKAGAFSLLNRLKLAHISNNLGDSKTLACHPYTTTHQRLTPDDKVAQGITEGLLRVSVGLEDANDLIADFRQALKG